MSLIKEKKTKQSANLDLHLSIAVHNGLKIALDQAPQALVDRFDLAAAGVTLAAAMLVNAPLAPALVQSLIDLHQTIRRYDLCQQQLLWHVGLTIGAEQPGVLVPALAALLPQRCFVVLACLLTTQSSCINTVFFIFRFWVEVERMGVSVLKSSLLNSIIDYQSYLLLASCDSESGKFKVM